MLYTLFTYVLYGEYISEFKQNIVGIYPYAHLMGMPEGLFIALGDDANTRQSVVLLVRGVKTRFNNR